ncbi:hypothetical protein PILCRDRAFT_84355 [Piloderma croceum F 1598]|uniref:Uncharacterized protein n=1 Tax=Piloderma croceum (strain F 1598) TaxID=765440 RepID=A0A0C3BUQ8_PILCF|nr:hypothetical protein PILCRDRAFT_84355 [Piloderma croceum F 1598]
MCTVEDHHLGLGQTISDSDHWHQGHVYTRAYHPFSPLLKRAHTNSVSQIKCGEGGRGNKIVWVLKALALTYNLGSTCFRCRTRCAVRYPHQCIGVAGTAGLEWILLIAASFATTSVPDVLTTTLPLQMGQLSLGKKAQVVDASRVVFAFARDNALPGSRWWKRMNHHTLERGETNHTQTPVNAVWLVMAGSAICGLLGFSMAALTSLAGAAVIGLYVSYAAPIFLRITSGRNKLPPRSFSLGRWYMPIGMLFPMLHTNEEELSSSYDVAKKHRFPQYLAQGTAE